MHQMSLLLDLGEQVVLFACLCVPSRGGLLSEETQYVHLTGVTKYQNTKNLSQTSTYCLTPIYLHPKIAKG